MLLAGRNTTAVGRAAHLLLYAGVRDIRLLDGGLGAWARAGLPLATGAAHRYAPVRDFGAAFPRCPHYLVHTPQVRLQVPALPLQAGAVLAGIRTWDEFTGKPRLPEYGRGGAGRALA